MADYMNYQVTRLSNATLSVPRYQISVQVVDSATQQTVLADFTGANALIFPAVLATLTQQQRDDFADMITGFLIRTKAGL